MPGKTQIEVYIETLSQLANPEHLYEKARLRRQNSAQAEGFTGSFAADPDGFQRPYRSAVNSRQFR